jgi:hypothetical protein
MTTPLQPSGKWSGRRKLAVILFGVSGVLLFLDATSKGYVNVFPALAPLVVGGVLLQSDIVRARHAAGLPDARRVGRPGKVAWLLGVGSLVAWAGSYFYMFSVPRNSAQAVVGICLFVAVGIACGVIWIYLALKLWPW